MAEPSDSPAGGFKSARAGKYLTFALGEEVYAIEILKVREIIGLMEVTAVPRAPEFVSGVIDLRGKIIPVIDLRRVFGMSEVEHTQETCIVVVDLVGVSTGVIVDRVREVLEIAEEEIEDTPSFGVGVNTDFMLGMGKPDGQVTVLLDIAKTLSPGEIDAIRSVERDA